MTRRSFTTEMTRYLPHRIGLTMFLLTAFCIHRTSVGEYPSPVWSLAYSPDGETLAVGIYQQVLLLDTKSWKVKNSIPEFMDSVRCVRYSRDGRRLVVSGGYPKEIGEIVFFDTSDMNYVGGTEHHVDMVEDFFLHPSGKRYVTVSMDYDAFVTDVAEGTILKSLKPHQDRVYAIAGNVSGEQFITSSADGTLKAWGMDGSMLAKEAVQVVRDLSFFPNSSKFIAAHSDGRLSLWSLTEAAGKWKLKQLNATMAHGGKQSYAVACLPDGQQVLSVGADKRALLWDIRGPIKELASDTDQLYAVAVSPDGKIGVAGGRSGHLLVLSIRDGSVIKKFVPPAPKLEEPAPAN